MPEAKDLIFKIDAFTPATMPMGRLAEYMADLSILLGEKASVHFVRLEEGSLALVHRIDLVAVPKVDERLRLVRTGDGPAEAQRAAFEIDSKLVADNACGVLMEQAGAELLAFPGINRIVEPDFGPFHEAGTIDGVVIRVGGQKSTVPIHLETRDGFESHCLATRELAKELAKHIFGPELRCHGTGRWHRDKAGNWDLVSFTISGFSILDLRPLTEIAAELREVEGNGWRAIADPWATLAMLRTDEDSES